MKHTISNPKQLASHLASNGVTISQVAKDLGIDYLVLYRQLNRYPFDAKTERGMVRTDKIRKHLKDKYQIEIKY